MTSTLSPVLFDPPLVNPSPHGLFAATKWRDEDGPSRWLGPGVDVRVWNYGGEDSYGVWAADPCALTDDLEEGDIKLPGDRPDWPDTFTHFTSWAADECALTGSSQEEVRARAQQVHRLQESNAVEAAFATRMLSDAGTPGTPPDLVAAVASLESALAVTNTVGVIHASPLYAAYAAQAQLITRSGSVLRTPLGHQWVFGGGYVDGLEDTLVATSPVFGWRGPVTLRTAIKQEHNRFYAIAERSLALGYEAVIGAATVTPVEPEP